MQGEKREHWLRLCVEAADERDAIGLLDVVSEINRFLREKEIRVRNVRREPLGYVIEAAADEKVS